MNTITIKCPFTSEETVFDAIKDNLIALKEDLPAGKMVSFYFVKNGDTEDTGLGINLKNPDSVKAALGNLDFYGLGFAATEITKYLKS